MFLNRHLVNAAHERRFLVVHDTGGWEVTEKEDSAVVRHVRRTRWQRVEPEIQQFDTTADELKRLGWIEH
jgi:hypothetical protein